MALHGGNSQATTLLELNHLATSWQSQLLHPQMYVLVEHIILCCPIVKIHVL